MAMVHAVVCERDGVAGRGGVVELFCSDVGTGRGGGGGVCVAAMCVCAAVRRALLLR